MVKARCFWYEDDGTPIDEGCIKGFNCPFVHPTEGQWDRLPPQNKKPPHSLRVAVRHERERRDERERRERSRERDRDRRSPSPSYRSRWRREEQTSSSPTTTMSSKKDSSVLPTPPSSANDKQKPPPSGPSALSKIVSGPKALRNSTSPVNYKQNQPSASPAASTPSAPPRPPPQPTSAPPLQPPCPLPEFPKELNPTMKPATPPPELTPEEKKKIWEERIKLVADVYQAKKSLERAEQSYKYASDILSQSQFLVSSLTDEEKSRHNSELRSLHADREKSKKAYEDAMREIVEKGTWPVGPPKDEEGPEKENMEREYGEIVKYVKELKEAAMNMSQMLGDLAGMKAPPVLPAVSAVADSYEDEDDDMYADDGDRMDVDEQPSLPSRKRRRVSDDDDDQDATTLSISARAPPPPHDPDIPTREELNQLLDRLESIEGATIDLANEITQYERDVSDNFKYEADEIVARINAQRKAGEAKVREKERMRVDGLIGKVREENEMIGKDVGVVGDEMAKLMDRIIKLEVDIEKEEKEKERWSAEMKIIEDRLKTFNETRETNLKAIQTLEAALEAYKSASSQLSPPRTPSSPISSLLPIVHPSKEYILTALREPIVQLIREGMKPMLIQCKTETESLVEEKNKKLLETVWPDMVLVSNVLGKMVDRLDEEGVRSAVVVGTPPPTAGGVVPAVEPLPVVIGGEPVPLPVPVSMPLAIPTAAAVGSATAATSVPVSHPPPPPQQQQQSQFQPVQQGQRSVYAPVGHFGGYPPTTTSVVSAQRPGPGPGPGPGVVPPSASSPVQMQVVTPTGVPLPPLRAVPGPVPVSSPVQMQMQSSSSSSPTMMMTSPSAPVLAAATLPPGLSSSRPSPVQMQVASPTTTTTIPTMPPPPPMMTGSTTSSPVIPSHVWDQLLMKIQQLPPPGSGSGSGTLTSPVQMQVGPGSSAGQQQVPMPVPVPMPMPMHVSPPPPAVVSASPTNTVGPGWVGGGGGSPAHANVSQAQLNVMRMMVQAQGQQQQPVVVTEPKQESFH